ncbi:MAG: DUF342 domain-containing protein [Lachnospiraceae bacterium]|nr:DUF342 domain-containing protein [Lachnospiraceae bacterium]
MASVNELPDTNEADVFELLQDDTKENTRDRFLGSRVTVRDGEMKAYLLLQKPGTGDEFTRDEILGLMEKHGVVEGINSARVNAMVKKHIYGKEMLVAEGTPAVDGQDGYYEFFFKVKDNKKKEAPKIREDGSVDYTSVNVIDCVEEEDRIATYHPAVQGTEGFTVRGKVIQPKKAKELPRYLTKGCRYEEEDLSYYATESGRVEVSKARLTVVGLQEFKHDIDNVFGNVDFKGDVIVHGNVETGVHVKATRSITVDGVCEGGCITAGEDIVIKGGVMGSETAVLKCGGDFLAEFVEYATIEAKGNISANHFLDSQVSANGVVSATGTNGAIIGGNVFGLKGVEAKMIGNDAYVKTIVEAGVRDAIIKKKSALQKQSREASDRLEEMAMRADEIERKIRLGNADEFIMEERKNMVRERVEKKTELKLAEDELEEIERILSTSGGAAIKAEDTVFIGTIVTIDNQQLIVEEDKKRVEFRIDEDNGLVSRPIVDW